MKKATSWALVLAAASSGVIGLGIPSAPATILTGPVVTIYSDNFANPASNVNAPSAAIVGNTPAVDTGLAGGSANSPYIGIATPAASGAPDAVWNYSGANSATITSPSANIATSGSTAGEDSNTITNLTLPLTPVLGWTYDLEATFFVPAASGGHGLEMAYLYNGGNGHNTSAQAISNNDPVGLILDRDANSSAGGYFDIFENTGTGSDNNFSPTSNALTGGAPGQTSVTVDILFTSTGSTTGNMSWYLNGVLVNSSPVAVSGLTGGISDISMGDNRVTGGVITNFSLTAVPEPTVAGLLLGGAGLAGLRRRRR